MDNIIQNSPRTLLRVNRANHEHTCHITICSNKIPIKRFFLPLVGSVCLVAFPIFQTYAYLPCLVFVSFFVIFWNFPRIITFMNSKPLYYEDLFMTGSNNNVDLPIHPRLRNKFENAFEWSLIFTNSLFTAALSEYWLYQAGFANSYVEILGVTGGILKIFQSINHISGGIILQITHILIRRELNNASNMNNNEVVIEMKEIHSDTNKIKNIICNVHTHPHTPPHGPQASPLSPIEVNLDKNTTTSSIVQVSQDVPPSGQD